MKKTGRILPIAVGIGILLVILLSSSATAEEVGHISGRAGVLYEPESGKILYGKNENARLPMASTTKIMTALVAVENTSITELVKVDGRAVGVEGSSAYLKDGDVLTVEELLYALLLQSANDAAVAIACHVGGSVEGFAEMMNGKAAEMGLVNTHFENPHGLDADGHYTTAKELATVAAEAMKNPLLREIFATRKRSFTNGERSRTYVNHNKLLHLYDGAVGVKTGYTRKCGRCLVGAAERDGLTLLSVTLDAPDDWRDHARMLDFGFASLEKIVLAESGERIYSVAVVDGEAEDVTVRNAESLSQIADRGEHEVKEYVKLPRFVTAPVSEGDPLGCIIYTVDGEYAGEVRLVATETVGKKEDQGFFGRLFTKIFG